MHLYPRIEIKDFEKTKYICNLCNSVLDTKIYLLQRRKLRHDIIYDNDDDFKLQRLEIVDINGHLIPSRDIKRKPWPTCSVIMEFEKGISFEGDKENDILQAEGERKFAVQD